MSYCKEEGKDKIVFLTPEDLSQPSAISIPEDEEPPGLILPNGEINWSCPCLGGMATGPCGVEFREAFTCFHFSKAEPKGSDCYEPFKAMQECMANYPSLYGGDDRPVIEDEEKDPETTLQQDHAGHSETHQSEETTAKTPA